MTGMKKQSQSCHELFVQKSKGRINFSSSANAESDYNQEIGSIISSLGKPARENNERGSART